MIKTFTIVTFGCRTNQAESRVIGEQLCRLGWKQINKDAEIIILNSCAVTTKAEREVRKEIRRLKRESPKSFLVVCGCWAEKVKSKKEKVKKLIDLVVENKNKEKITDYCSSPDEASGRELLASARRIKGYKDKYLRSSKAIVKIQDGCDNFCTYCIVPYLRGRSKSREMAEIIKEINQLVNKGIEEIILTGIDIASYKLKTQSSNVKTTAQNSKVKNDLAELIKLILLETKIKKISFGSINLEAFNEGFIDFLSKVARNYSLGEAKGTRDHSSKSLLQDSVSKLDHNLKGQNANIFSKGRFVPFLATKRLTTHFHIPLQSGCDQTLKRMKRKYTTLEVLDKIKVLKKAIPGFSFSTDMIVGFPGETGEEFSKSLKFLKVLKKELREKFIKAHIFRYSGRPGTVAFAMEKKWGRVAESVKKYRSKKLNKLINSIKVIKTSC